jgi:hypothetical protein
MAMDTLSPSSGKDFGEKPSDSRNKIPGNAMRLMVNGKEETLDSNRFFERYGVTKWVRFQEEEFDANFDTVVNDQLIDHFNVKDPNHEVGKKYLVMRIKKEENRDPKAPPLLTPEGAFIVECVSMTHNIQDELKDEYFEHSLKGISKESLKTVLKTRYKATDDDLGKQGIAHTRFKVVKTAEEVKVIADQLK